jgi:hypothetical protein
VRIPNGLQQLPADPAAGQIYGEPIQTPDGATVIPVARFRRRRTEEECPEALGVFVVREGKASWVPVVDADRIALIGVITGLLAAVFASLAVLRQPPWPRMTIVK